MLAFRGTKQKGGNSAHFSFEADIGGGWRGIPACSGSLYTTIGIKKVPSYSRDAIFAWGYNGNGPELLAATILGIYASVQVGHRLSSANHLMTFDEMLQRKKPDQPWPPFARGTPYLGDDFIKKHYKAFTKEVIAKLPDNWTLTESDIDEWVKGKG